jgi:hypothetical protein
MAQGVAAGVAEVGGVRGVAAADGIENNAKGSHGSKEAIPRVLPSGKKDFAGKERPVGNLPAGGPGWDAWLKFRK